LTDKRRIHIPQHKIKGKIKYGYRIYLTRQKPNKEKRPLENDPSIQKNLNPARPPHDYSPVTFRLLFHVQLLIQQKHRQVINKPMLMIMSRKRRKITCRRHYENSMSRYADQVVVDLVVVGTDRRLRGFVLAVASAASAESTMRRSLGTIRWEGCTLRTCRSV